MPLTPLTKDKAPSESEPAKPTGAQPAKKAKERKARKQAGLQVVTANISGLVSLKDELNARDCLSKADIILIQEHKCGPEEIEGFAKWCRRVGYRAAIAPAVVKAKAQDEQ